MALELQGVVPLLWVYDMPTAIQFYHDKLGFEILATSPVLSEDHYDWAMLGVGQAKFMLNTTFESDEERPVRPQSSAASQRDVWLYFDCSDVETVYATLRAIGLDVQRPSVTYYGMNQTFICDPDGYRLCFQSPSKS